MRAAASRRLEGLKDAALLPALLELFKCDRADTRLRALDLAARFEDRLEDDEVAERHAEEEEEGARHDEGHDELLLVRVEPRRHERPGLVEDVGQRDEERDHHRDLHRNEERRDHARGDHLRALRERADHRHREQVVELGGEEEGGNEDDGERDAVRARAGPAARTGAHSSRLPSYSSRPSSSPPSLYDLLAMPMIRTLPGSR